MSRAFWIRVVIGVAAVSALGGAALASGKVPSFVADLTGIGKAVPTSPADLPGAARSAAARATGDGGDASGGFTAASASAEPSPASFSSSEATGDNPPVVEAVVEGTQGLNGWYTSDVALSWKIEGGTAVEGECAPQSITTDGVSEHSCTATAEDGSTRTTKVTVARDATAPVVTPKPDRGPDHNGWYNKQFEVAWTAEDATSGVDACTPASPYSGPDTATGSLSGACTDKAGNSASATYEFKYDATAPNVTATPDRDPDHNGWYNKTVTIVWSAPDSTCDAPTVYSGPDGQAKLSGSCTDQAGNTGTGSITIDYDETAPSIVINDPASDAVYLLNQPVNANYFCSDATSGLGSCTGTVANGSALATGSVGSHSFGVSAVDQAGNKASASRSYSVRYAPAGTLCGGVRGHEILQPIAADGSSVFNHGRTVPAKFRVCDYFGTPVTTAGVVTAFRIVAVDGVAADMAPKSTSSHSEYRSGDGQWIFNVDTKPLKAGSHYEFRIGLNDGTAIGFAFRLR